MTTMLRSLTKCSLAQTGMQAFGNLKTEEFSHRSVMVFQQKQFTLKNQKNILKLKENIIRAITSLSLATTQQPRSIHMNIIQPTKTLGELSQQLNLQDFQLTRKAENSFSTLVLLNLKFILPTAEHISNVSLALCMASLLRLEKIDGTTK